MKLQRTIKAFIRAGEQSGYVAECLEIPVVTQGATVDQVIQNLQEAVQLHLEGENLAELGLAPNPALLVTLELEPVHATPYSRPWFAAIFLRLKPANSRNA